MRGTHKCTDIKAHIPSDVEPSTHTKGRSHFKKWEKVGIFPKQGGGGGG